MMASLRGLVQRVARSPVPPPLDDAFVRRVRDELEPLLASSGFAFQRAEPSVDGDTRSTVVRYVTNPGAFAARFPAIRGHLRTEGSPLELGVALDADRRTVATKLEGWELSALLAAVRAGPGAPPPRRHLDDGEAAALPPDAAIDRAAELLRRLFDAAAPR